MQPVYSLASRFLTPASDFMLIPRRLMHDEFDKQLKWLRWPWRCNTVSYIQEGQFSIHSYDQPGRWMNQLELESLHNILCQVAKESLDEIPTYGIFTAERRFYANRVIAIVFDESLRKPAGFTAMVYLPFKKDGKITPIIHLGLTMINRSHRGKRLQTPLFKKIFILPIINQLRLSFLITNIAASPAGIGATSDYFFNVYPNYQESIKRKDIHLKVAEQILKYHRSEFGCSNYATWDPETFVVHGSNQKNGGGAHQFIKDDPVSRYRIDKCNDFCKRMLNFTEGDELFQVGEARFFSSLWASRSSRRHST